MAAPLPSEAPSHIGAAPWLDWPSTRAVFAALAARGFEARAVGGAVRNTLLGQHVSEIDLATPASPQDVIAAAEAAGLRAIPTGLAHGTVTVVADGRAFEVTTLREDVETYGRHAKVAFTADWAADARRRDFTLNALYCGSDGRLFDPLGGWSDLVRRRIRFIGDARARIREDYLRILRFFRFAGEYGEGSPDREGLAACVAERSGIVLLSPERVRQELLRLLVAPRGPEAVRTMIDWGLLSPLLGRAPRPLFLERVAGLEATVGLAADGVLRLAALAVETKEDADWLRDRLRLSNAEHTRLAFVETGKAMLDPAAREKSAKAVLYRAGPEALYQTVLLEWARSNNGDWHEIWTLARSWQRPVLPVGGDDVIALGIPVGPRIGALLDAAENWWIAGGFAADRAELLEKLRELSAR